MHMTYIFGSLEELEKFLNDLNSIISKYGYTTVADAKCLLDLKEGFIDHNYGWIKEISYKELDVNVYVWPDTEELGIKVTLPEHKDIRNIDLLKYKSVLKGKQTCKFCSKFDPEKNIKYSIKATENSLILFYSVLSHLRYCPVCGRNLSE